MTIDEANAIVDQLNDVFAGKSTAVPSAQSLREALETFNAHLNKVGFDPKPIPEEISGNENILNKDVASLVDAMRNHANQVISAARSKAKLEELLPEVEARLGSRKIRI